MKLSIPDVIAESSIVMVEPDADGVYPVEWLGMQSALLAGSALPGQGHSIIVGHNTLNTEEYGPFALLSTLEEGDRIFISGSNDQLMIFQVYANEKIGSHDIESLYKVSAAFENTVTLLTCEDEMLTGGYASRRIVSAKLIDMN